jgi:hypothetical protein
MEVRRGKAPGPGARIGGADSNLIYVGPHTPEIDALLLQVGIGVRTEESCLLRALEVAGVPVETLNQIRPFVLTQFLLVK